jgi:hypothetical protein
MKAGALLDICAVDCEAAEACFFGGRMSEFQMRIGEGIPMAIQLCARSLRMLPRSDA